MKQKILMEDINTHLDGITDIVENISKGIRSNIVHCLEESHKKNDSFNNLKILETYDQIPLVKNTLKDRISKRQENINKNSTYFSKLKCDVEESINLKNSLKEQVAHKRAKRKEFLIKISKLEKKKEHLLEKRDQIQTCKLLTNTVFYLHGSDVTGYSKCNETLNIKPFEYNSSKIPKEKIIDLMYDNILSVCSKSPNVDQ